MKVALITGITGQDGSYLSELLLEKGYDVHGIIRRSSSLNTGRLDGSHPSSANIFDKLYLHYGDVTDGTSLRRILDKVQPTEVYNLAAQSHVMVSFEQPEYTHEVVALGALKLFEACRDVVPKARIYQAGSSEMFGGGVDLNETSPFRPKSPYAVAKVAAHWHAVGMRDAYGMHISNGILFNHESPRRGRTFVTQKIAYAAARREAVTLGNMHARRDWGWAPDYVRAMWMMLQADKPGDYVVATGTDFSVSEFVTLAQDEVGWAFDVIEDERYKRPNDVERLRGDARKIRKALGWHPEVWIERMVHLMVEAARCAR